MGVTAADVGRRVTVRYRLAAPEPGASATDVVGTLVSHGHGSWVVRRRDGSQVEVPAGDVIVAKVVD